MSDEGEGTPDGRLTVAAFRPDDERAERAAATLADLGVEPVVDPMLAVEPTGETPARSAYTVFTSRTGADLVDAADWDATGTTVCAIGAATAEALRAAGYTVDVVPEEFSSAGLVAALRDEVGGERVTIARSDHGSAVLPDGLAEAEATVEETVLYRLVRPSAAGESTELAAAGDLDAALFTSSLTVEHFLAAAVERGVETEARAGLATATVGAIGEPTRETAADAGIAVDVVPEETSFAVLARETVAAARESSDDAPGRRATDET
ncbi:uroporphyrinogen-III synthase [Halobacteriales archaeon SW_7_68_16]|nr:MAG: uroporphyrinogen-III synthase [Halobacteriales archaeon SW_7_68_16]